MDIGDADRTIDPALQERLDDIVESMTPEQQVAIGARYLGSALWHFADRHGLKRMLVEAALVIKTIQSVVGDIKRERERPN